MYIRKVTNSRCTYLQTQSHVKRNGAWKFYFPEFQFLNDLQNFEIFLIGI